MQIEKTTKIIKERIISMLKIIKKIFIISLILFIQSLIVIYKIISKFWRKNNSFIKNFIKKLDRELRVELQ